MNSELLKDIRLFKKMTQEEFASWLGVSKITIALIESGHRNVSDTVVSKLAHKFDVTDDDFIKFRERQKNLREFF